MRTLANYDLALRTSYCRQHLLGGKGMHLCGSASGYAGR
jgi:hypothetical protein